MPELPEVETTCRGIQPYVQAAVIDALVVRNGRLRWLVDQERMNQELKGQRVRTLTRRGKYLLLWLDTGVLLLHLGMSGSLRILDSQVAFGKHDHIDLRFEKGLVLRYNDPRRFGAFVWHSFTDGLVENHSLLAHLGPEPLLTDFTGDYLYKRSRGHQLPVKSFIMDAKVVVGIGNIYANEALFAAGIHPLKSAARLSRPKAEKLVVEIKSILTRAINRGGTTLRDFVGGDGKPGYFAQELNVYGRGGEPCRHCAKPLTERRLQNRTTVFCTLCQR
jgi:formamidopyrimidine-DNA glycosylase